MPGEKIKIKKEDLPRARRKWSRKPVTKIKESGKIYKRRRIKRNTKKALRNEYKDR